MPIIHTITIKNPVEAACSTALAALIKPCLSFPTAYYIQGPFHKTRKESIKTLMKKGKNGIVYFWAGLIERVQEYCIEKNIEINVVDESKEEITVYEADLPGITFRPDQIWQINSFLDKPRGILVAPTGSGKTVLGFSCLSGFENIKVLWLCHKKSLMMQAYTDGLSFGFKSIGRVGDGFAEYDKDITIATRQSFKKLADEYGHLYDAVVVDEVHHLAKSEGEYPYVLTRVLAPIRLGLTATLPREGEPFLVATGLIGPVLKELTINMANELGILAKPRIKILRIAKDYNIAALKTYAKVYEAAIVQRLDRNVLIAVTTKKHTDKGETVLIMINQIEHGRNILEQLVALGIKAEFVWGATDADTQDKMRHALNDGHISCVICSSVWTEGINIPNLNVVINAAGGKAEIRTLQSIGRGLRKTKDKDEVWIYDILDLSHRFLIEHFGERLCLYLDNDWL